MNSSGYLDEFWWLYLDEFWRVPRLILVFSQMNSGGLPNEFWWLHR